MRVAVIGGTGRTGRRMLTELLAAGHQPVCIGRSAGTAQLPDGVEGRSADVLDPAAVEAALAGCDAVFVSLSIPRTSRNPFAALTGPTDLHSRSMKGILDAMRAVGIERIVKISAQGVGDSAPRAGWGFRLLVAVSNLKPAFADHAVADALLAASDRRWTVLRPTMLVDAPATGKVYAGDQATWSWTRTATGDVARFAVEILQDPEGTWRRTVTVCPIEP